MTAAEGTAQDAAEEEASKQPRTKSIKHVEGEELKRRRRGGGRGLKGQEYEAAGSPAEVL